MKTIPQWQGDIRRNHKSNSDSSERQYIAKVRETVFTLHCTFEFETTRMGESLIDLLQKKMGKTKRKPTSIYFFSIYDFLRFFTIFDKTSKIVSKT